LTKKGNYNKHIWPNFNLEILIIIILLIIIIINIINITNLLNLTNISNWDIILSIKESKGTLEIDKVKIEGLSPQIDKLRDGSIYIAGITAGARIIKNSSIPLAAKLGTTIGLGGASLLGYRIVQNSLRPNVYTDKVTASIDKIDSSITNTYNDKSKFINKLVEGSNNTEDNYNTISSLDIEQLQLIFYLNLILIYLLIMTVIFLLMKYVSTLNLKFDFLINLPYGKSLQNLIVKLFKWWETTSSIWIYVILVCVIINLSISAWGIYIILSHIK
jgi:hypothetical protein